MNDYIMSECSTCGTTWVTGRYAHHSCTAKLVSDNDALKARVTYLETHLKEEVRVSEFLRKTIDTHSANQDKRLEYLNDLLSEVDRQNSDKANKERKS
jgi:hypothetical protein